MKRIAVFPGSFDPFTKGHESIVNRILPLFDELIVSIGHNSDKKYFFSLEKRVKWIENVFNGEGKIKIMEYNGLTVEFCRKVDAKYIIRGLRTTADFEFEKAITQMNKALADDIETIFILPLPELSAINSTIIRDIIRNGGDASQFVPAGVTLVE